VGSGHRVPLASGFFSLLEAKKKKHKKHGQAQRAINPGCRRDAMEGASTLAQRDPSKLILAEAPFLCQDPGRGGAPDDEEAGRPQEHAEMRRLPG